MISFSGLTFLYDLSQGLVVVGLVGVGSLFFFPKDRRILERSLGVLFTLVAAGGVGVMWKVEKLIAADRDLTPVQQATLSEAIGQFPTLKFEVFTSRGDREAHALALKILDVVKAGSGAMPHFDDQMLSLPCGVVLILDDKDADFITNSSIKSEGRSWQHA